MKDELLSFIAKAHRNTYAAPKVVKKRYRCNPVLEGHKDHHFIDGDWAYHDSYAGWSWPPGREVVFFKGKPVWCMSYQGKASEGLEKAFIDEQAAQERVVFRFLFYPDGAYDIAFVLDHEEGIALSAVYLTNFVEIAVRIRRLVKRIFFDQDVEYQFFYAFSIRLFVLPQEKGLFWPSSALPGPPLRHQPVKISWE